MKDETGGVTITEFVELKPQMYSFMIDISKEHKKAKGVNKNVVAMISHNKYKDVLLHKKRLRTLISRIQRKHIELELMKSRKFHLVLTIKHTSKTMDLID